LIAIAVWDVGMSDSEALLQAVRCFGGVGMCDSEAPLQAVRCLGMCGVR